MVLHYTRLKKLVEPIGVPKSSSSEVSSTPCFGIRYHRIAVGIQYFIQLIHSREHPRLSVDIIDFEVSCL